MGLAGVGARHAEAIRHIPLYDLVGLVDRDRRVVHQAAATFGTKPYATLAKMLAEAEPDAVVIATPPNTHCDLAKLAIQARAHVYLEKPVAPTISAARQIIVAAADRGVVLQPGFQHRFLPASQDAHRLMTSQAIGDCYRAELFATHWLRTPRYYLDRPWRATWASSGGGAAFNQAIHQIDLLLWLAGEVVSVSADASRSSSRVQVEDRLVARVVFSSGASGQIVVSTRDLVGLNTIMLHGDTGSMRIEPDRVHLVRTTHSIHEIRSGAATDYPHRFAEHEVRRFPNLARHELFVASHTAFLRAVEDRRPAQSDRREATRAGELINAAYLSAITSAPVPLPLDGERYDRAFAALVDERATLPIRTHGALGQHVLWW